MQQFDIASCVWSPHASRRLQYPKSNMLALGRHHRIAWSAVRASARRTLSSAVMATPLGIGHLPLSPEELRAEQELLAVLPEFQQASAALGDAGLPNWKRAALAVPPLERAVEICRASMGFQSVYLLAALRQLTCARVLQGDFAAASRAMHERGELMSWPMFEQERALRLWLRSNAPNDALAWCQKDEFTALFPKDATVPLKWTLYELLAQSLRDGPDFDKHDDPLFTQAVEVLRCKKDVVAEQQGAADDSLLSRDIPYLLAQYASLCLVSSGVLRPVGKRSQTTAREPLSDAQLVALNQAEVLWKEALTWVETTAVTDSDEKDDVAPGVDAPFEAWTHTNLGELLLRKQKPEAALEHLGKALKIQQRDKSGNALALSRTLGKIAQGCHAVGQAVSAEGLFTTAVEAFEKEKVLSISDQVEFASVLRAYGDLLQNWEKREGGAEQKYAQADAVEERLGRACEERHSRAPLHPVFYLPL